MRPTRLTARSYRSFADLDYAFADGATAVVGSNGAGKSTLIGAVEIALFGPRSRSLEPLVREGSDDMQLCLEFAHGDGTYRVRRGWKKGKSSLDLEIATPPGWIPMSQGSAADTQELLERIIGLNRTTFTSSGYLAQRASDSFTGAQPKDRKRILSDALALDQWQADADKVGADRRQVEKSSTAIAARIDGLAERAAQVETLTAERDTLTETNKAAVTGEAAARTEAEQHAVRAADLDQADTAWKVANANAVAARAANSAHLEKAQAAKVARERLDGERSTLASLERLDAEREAVRVKNTALIEQDAARTAALARRQKSLDDLDQLETKAVEYADKAMSNEDARLTLEQKLTAIVTAAVDSCDRCGQALHDQARERMAESVRDDLKRLAEVEADRVMGESKIAERIAEARAVLESLVVADEPEGLRATSDRLLELINVPVDLATVRERIAGFEQTVAAIDTDEYRETARRLSFELAESESALAAIFKPEPGAADLARAAALQAKAASEAHSARARTASERLAAVNALLEQAESAAAEHALAVTERDRLHTELDILARLEQAFGRDGIPAWIVESQALPQIETEANRILSRLGGAISRVELRTERETKTGERRDALDVICLTDDGERALETFSGGEQSRAEIALALGLVDVLQSRRDADLRYLALDEPSGLDSQGTEALAEILRDRAAGTVVLLASHDAGLRDQFDVSISIERGPSGSRLVA